MQLFTAVQLSVALALVRIVHGQAAEWGQCGGIGWSGATTCVSGTTCTVMNAYYSQCLPGAAQSAPPPVTSAPVTTPASPTTAPATSAPAPTSPAGACATASTVSGFSNAKLPNPFIFNDGTPVQSAADWQCRSQQLLALIQGYEAGALPGKPSSLTASLSKSGTSGTLTITASNSGSSITFAPKITFPSGNPPAGGWPLLIVYEGLSIPVPAGIATLIFENSDMAQQNDASTSRGVGLFYNLYGKTATASAMTAWAWGVSRIIDALEQTPSANINTQKIGVTGCSRNGKGALMAGALEPRIALTIPQESGSGGDACWRLSKYEQDQGSVVQTATEIVTENVWFSTNFANYVNNLNTLPFDHHSLAALIAPRPMISFENTDYVWLSPLSSFGCMTAAHTVWDALGVADHHGFEQVGGHAHCAWPSSLTPQLNAFFNRFLLGQNVSTTFFDSNKVFNGVTWNAAQWIDWTTPQLH
ncbi:uncharacterized protein TRAVEDRAFT_26272 [Trametes versicolor FP-101664 SS1]|uniref:uncharacterized protein n=1 Tax=Trametes versicolor (strain FP-101664) TaxID=717944 RepID=UPI00046244E3|nr:uncharacterized protein TRAVEDRAFT_26272 [Trametes versicolor FP-101664 SS1]EIW63683.1 hypothetical protein TRAVEDRAFT_26272 [Trametes versicolor FP-101664 SS1]